ncbi:unnamed protein product [Brachionus calyciflorus]|uniref:BZIP domain-containing protein n=1 Tax=Brachionus calyciflorus TaxID=104777 RepID=A0A813ZBL9_9BILA|nr:unnamed protein product [Brachionus calyciflorus]
MRNKNKRSFFETLIRLTLLANVLQYTSRFNYYEFDLVEPNNLFNSHNYIVKQNMYQNKSQNYLDDILMYQRFNYLIAPASFLPSQPSQKDLINLLHDPTYNKEDIEMEIDLQTILQQDIDLGIGSNCNSNQTKQIEFYKETQKNADILATTGLFEQNRVPEGYKLVLEEDTGEYFLILMTNDSNKTEYSTRIQIKNSGSVNNLTSNKTENQLYFPQVSFNQDFEKLNENLGNFTNLDDTLSRFDTDNLLNDDWINQLLNDPQQQSEPIYDQIKIHNDKMLSTLNENQTFAPSPLLNYTNNYFMNNDTIYNDTAQFETMLNQAIEAHEKDLCKTSDDSLLRDKSSLVEELDLSNLMSYVQNDTINKVSSVNTTMKVLNINGDLLDDKAKMNRIDEHIGKKNNNNDNINNSVFNMEFKQEIIDSELEPQFVSISQIKNNVSTSNNCALSTLVQTPALSGLIHNHTYLATSNSDEDSLIHHPYSYKNKLKKMLKNIKKSDDKSEKHTSRDEQLLRENNIVLSLNQIVDTSADEFNDLIREYALNTDQIIVAKDIRRRGKNKVAAQICRKRKLDSIDSLKENVENLHQKRSILCAENTKLQKEIREATERFNKLYQEALGNSLNSNDPTIVSINNLREQLNTKEVQTSEIKTFHSDDSRGLDTSFSQNSSVLHNESDEDDDDDDEDEDDIGSSDESDFDEDEENSMNSYSANSSIQNQTGKNTKKLRKF